MSEIFDAIDTALKTGEGFVLATILNKSGSAPRHKGAKMLIREDYSIIGTIGGGLLEAMTIKASARVLQQGESIVEEFILPNDDISDFNNSLRGKVSVFLEYISCGAEEIVALYKKAIEFKQQCKDFILITSIREDQGRGRRLGKWLCTETAFYGPEDDMLQEVVKEVRESYSNIELCRMEKENVCYLIEPFTKYDILYIAGAGHIAQTVADLAKKMDFYVVVIDDREEFANSQRFNTADEIRVISSFDYFTDYVKIDNNSYVVIVTRGSVYDNEVLSQVLRTDAKYIGMIGSRDKCSRAISSLMAEGFTQEELQRIYCPIGLSLNADTPMEIAISIAAELISIKRGYKHEVR